MFLERLLEKNRSFADRCINLHRIGKILPDSYVIDVASLIANSKKIYDAASKKQIRLFFMLKQVGRNPFLAKKLLEIGYEGAVCVDFNEALLMMKHQIPIGNVGHLVQTPTHLLEKIVAYGASLFTIFSYEKLKQLNDICAKLQLQQKVILKVYNHQDTMYPGQEGGIFLPSLDAFLKSTKQFKNIEIVGVTSFPCFLYKDNVLTKTNNYTTVLKACEILQKNNLNVEVINIPSANGLTVIDEITIKNVVLEPGHALSGSMPFEEDTLPCVCYISEISHTFNENSYCFGGGYYRRSNVQNALVIGEKLTQSSVIPQDATQIDYHFCVRGKHTVGDTVLMAFRFQIFVCRSRVVLLENEKIIGVYSALGEKYE